MLYRRPSWQTIDPDAGPPDSRLVPDIAAVGDPFTGVKFVFGQQVLVGGDIAIRADLGRLRGDHQPDVRGQRHRALGELEPGALPGGPEALRHRAFAISDSAATRSHRAGAPAMTW